MSLLPQLRHLSLQPTFTQTRSSRSYAGRVFDVVKNALRSRRLPWVVGTIGCVFLSAPTVHGLNPKVAPTDYSLRGWQTEHGLPSGKIRKITQTPDGYLWVTTALGLARFDGIQFTVHDPTSRPDLTSNNFYTATRTRDGAMWFGTALGIYRFQNDRFERFDTGHGLPHNFIRCVTELRDGSLLIGTSQGVALARDGQIQPLDGPWKDISGIVRAHIERPDGTHYVGTETGLWRIDRDKSEKISGKAGLPNTGYICFLEGKTGELWLGTLTGVYRLLANGRVESVGAEIGLSDLRVHCFAHDRDDNVWIGTYGGLFRYSAGKCESAPYDDGFGVSLITDLIEDGEGTLWVGSNIGLFRLTDSPFAPVNHRHGLDRAGAYEVRESRDGSWWFGMWGGGVFRYNPGQPATQLAGVPSGLNVIYSLHETDDGALWIAANSDLFQAKDGVVKSFLLKGQEAKLRAAVNAQPDLTLDGVVHGRINDIISDGADGLWLLPYAQALYHYRDGRFRIYTPKSGMPTAVPRHALRSRNGDLWLSFPDSALVARVRDEKWKIYPFTTSMTHAPAIRKLFEDSAGAIWAASDRDGLFRFKADAWKNYGIDDGLSHNTISGIAEDDLGFLWASTPHGLMRIARQDFDDFDAGKIKRVRSRLFNRSDGVPVTETNPLSSPGMVKMRDGRLLVAAEVGAVVVDPSAVSFNPHPPPVHIEGVAVERRDVPLSAPISLPAGSREIEIRYTAVSLLAPEKVRFRVQLAPLDAGWVDAGTRRDIRYPRLPAGHYTFRVIACNNDGVWNEQGASIAFTVEPFFYQSIWFYAVAAGLIAAGAWGGHRLRVREVNRRARMLERVNEDLERRVEQRTAALAQQTTALAERSAELAKICETLRASEYFYHSLVESLPQIILRKDAQSRFTYANTAFAEIVGQPREAIIGKSDEDFYPAAVAAKFRAADVRVMERREVLEYEDSIERGGRKRYLHIKKVPLIAADGAALGVQVLFWDITAFRETEEKLKEAQQELLETSRLAGMAEVASGVLHNIGNAMNSVNISASMVADRLRNSKIVSLKRVAQLMLEQGDRLGEFVATDPRGQKLPSYLEQLADVLEKERDGTMVEVETLRSGVEHIKEIVVAQQSFARVSGVSEMMDPVELIEHALRISEAGLAKEGVVIIRDFSSAPVVNVQKQKVLQVLLNVIKNARDSLIETGRPDKQLKISLRLSAEGWVQILVTDNGLGISAENLTRIFAFGFTTKKTGHGFGLHSSALVAREAGGSLTARSEGPGRGATFVFELPPAKVLVADEPVPTPLASDSIAG